MDYRKIVRDLSDLQIGKIIEYEPMYKHTTYKVGGPARIFTVVEDLPALKRAMSYIRSNDIPYMIVGRGSNLLFSDREFDCVIISLEKLNRIDYNGNIIKAQAGVSMIALAYQSAKYGLSGFEFMGGIPGAIGGGIYMNAGAYLSSISDVFLECHVLDENNEIIKLTHQDMDFGYRYSALQDHYNWILIDATFVMKAKDPGEIIGILDRRKERRMATQPWNFACAGSIFRNPEEKPAWKYVDEAGLRGYEIGGAQVSPKHSNFIVNNGYASARDILDLIILVEKKVRENTGIHLRKEVILVNWE